MGQIQFTFQRFKRGLQSADAKKEPLKLARACQTNCKTSMLRLQDKLGTSPACKFSQITIKEYGPTFTKGGHKERAVYHVREWRFISP